MTILARPLDNTVKPRFKDAKQHSTQLVWIKDAKINKRARYANTNHTKLNASVKQDCTSLSHTSCVECFFASLNRGLTVLSSGLANTLYYAGVDAERESAVD